MTADLKVVGGSGRDGRKEPFPVRLLELYQRFSFVGKTGTNAHFNYKFMEESVLKGMLNEAMRDLHIIIGNMKVAVVGECTPRSCVVLLSLDLVDGLAQDGDKGVQAVHLEGLGGGVDSSDKAPMKAVVAAFKYALANGLSIQTGDEPEAGGGSDRAAAKDLARRIKAATTPTELNLLKTEVVGWQKSRKTFAKLNAGLSARMKTLTGEQESNDE